MHVPASIACALGLAAIAAAQASKPSAPPAGSVVGKVVDVLGTPIAGAAIWATCADREVGRSATDKLGAFLLRGLPLERLCVRAEVAGFRTEAAYEWLDASDPQTTVKLQLYECAPVRGVIRGPQGRPLAGALVLLSSPDKHIGDGDSDHGWTGPDGAYELPQAPIGKILVRVICRGYDATCAQSIVTEPTTQDFRLEAGPGSTYVLEVKGPPADLLPKVTCRIGIRMDCDEFNHCRWDLGRLWPHTQNGGTLVYADLPTNLLVEDVHPELTGYDDKTAGDGELAQPGRHKITTQMAPWPSNVSIPHRIRGVLRDPTGKPLAGLKLVETTLEAPAEAVTVLDGRFTLQTKVSESRYFMVQLNDSDYVLHFEPRDRRHRITCAGCYYAEDEPARVHELVADRVAHVSGTVHVRGGKPLPDATVELLADDAEDQVAFRVANTTFAKTRTRSDGTFLLSRLDGHLGQDLWLRVRAPDQADFVSGPHRIEPGRELRLGTFTIPPPASVEGTILDRDGVPRPGVDVTLFFDGERTSAESCWCGHTDRLGGYRFLGLQAGEYSVRVDPPHSHHVAWPAYGRAKVEPGQRAVIAAPDSAQR